MKQTFFLLLFIAGTWLISCSSGSNTAPVTPPISGQDIPEASRDSNRILWGYYKISVDSDRETIEVIPNHEALGHWNVLKFLEGGICTDCVSVPDFWVDDPGEITVEVEITHPFASMNFTGFDVRGIAMFDGSHEFPETGVTVSNSFAGDGYLEGADGLTALYNPTTIAEGPYKGYMDGKLATPTTPSATANGFHLYNSELPAGNERLIFMPGDSITRQYNILMPSGDFVFGYAVDASWAPPTVKPVTDPASDFPPEANCPEPYKITVGREGTDLATTGGLLRLNIFVYDHGGDSTYTPPKVECPELWSGYKTAVIDSTFPGYTKWVVDITNDNLAPAGDYQCLVVVEDNENASSPPHLNLTTFNTVHLTVQDDSGWAYTWGGSQVDSTIAVTSDTYGNIYIAGTFNGAPGESIDFDPGPNEDLHESNGASDIFMSVYNPWGVYRFTETWGGPGYDAANDIEFLAPDQLFMVGYFSDTVDFASWIPSATVTSNGSTDAFALKMDTYGDVKWVKAWGGTAQEGALAAVARPSSPLRVVGYFSSDTDFAPDDGGLVYSPVGLYDAFYQEFDVDGNWQAASVWGGTGYDTATGVGSTDTAQFFISGTFEDAVDFNPGPGTENRTSNGARDAYLLSLSAAETFDFVKTWGGGEHDEALTLTTTSAGTPCVGGYFSGSVDFDPDGAGDIRTSTGLGDAYLLQYDDAGNYQWCRTFGGTGNDVVLGLKGGSAGDIFMGGYFVDTVDFDPGTGLDEFTSNGGADAFIGKYSVDGFYQWAAAFGGSAGDDAAYGLTTYDAIHVYASGVFWGTVDFAPPPDSDEHASNGFMDVFVVKYFQDGTW